MARSQAAAAPRHTTAPTRRRAQQTTRTPARRSSGPAKGRTAAKARPANAAGAGATAARTAPRGRAAAARAAGSVAVPRTAPAVRPRKPAPRSRPARPGAAPFVRRLIAGPVGGLLDRVLRGRACVAVFGVLLVGVVFFNVSLLQMNRGITATSAKSTALSEQNQKLRAKLSKLDSSERIQHLAVQRGYSLPAAGDVGYIKGDPQANARRAVKRIVAPGTGDGVASRPIGAGTGSESTPAPAATAQAPAQTAIPAAAPTASATPPSATPSALPTTQQVP
ncbi:MAG: hypothetical protein QOJ07_1761 [Thermoleophilaceae bacterium]|nr:hypothetical protein [Thermoleophilaceae bacterium]